MAAPVQYKAPCSKFRGAVGAKAFSGGNLPHRAEELIELDARIAGYDRKIRELYRHSEICQRLGGSKGSAR
jgi:hypothetical protein